jgi:hypothetical protein
MFAIHIASCLVDIKRSVLLFDVVNALIKKYPDHPMYIGFDIVGMEHSNSAILHPLIDNNKNIHCFTHLNGLGYSWNHPWTLHNYNIVLQIEDDWSIGSLDANFVNQIFSDEKMIDTPSLFILNPLKEILSTIFNRHESKLFILDSTKPIQKNYIHIFSNHPHFETRKFRNLIDKHLERTTPPGVEVNYIKKCSALINEFTTYSFNTRYFHTGRKISVNHSVSWTNNITSNTFKNDIFSNIIKDIEHKIVDYDLLHKTNGQNIYDLLRLRTNKSLLVFFPNIWMIQIYRLHKIIPFVSVFFEQLLFILDNNTNDTETYIKTDEVKKYYPVIQQLNNNIYILRK